VAGLVSPQLEEELTKRHAATKQTKEKVEVARVEADVKVSKLETYRSLFEKGKLTFEQFQALMAESTSVSAPPVSKNTHRKPSQINTSCRRMKSEEEPLPAPVSKQQPVPEHLFDFIGEWLQPGTADDIISSQEVLDKYLDWSYLNDHRISARAAGFGRFNDAMAARGYVTWRAPGRLTRQICGSAKMSVFTSVRWNPNATLDFGPQPEELESSIYKEYILVKTTNSSDTIPVWEAEEHFTEWLRQRGHVCREEDYLKLRKALVSCRMGVFMRGNTLNAGVCKGGVVKPCFRFVVWKK